MSSSDLKKNVLGLDRVELLEGRGGGDASL